MPAKPVTRRQIRIMVGLPPEDLDGLDELAKSIDRNAPNRSLAVRVAVREALATRKEKRR